MTRPGFWPRYEPVISAGCPRCGAELIDEGLAGFWCASCREAISPAEVAYFDDGDDRD
jgi:tRNA(Ile2) C34 agmatinyltransferase TiaS